MVKHCAVTASIYGSSPSRLANKLSFPHPLAGGLSSNIGSTEAEVDEAPGCLPGESGFESRRYRQKEFDIFRKIGYNIIRG